MALTDAQAKKAKAEAKPYKLADSLGLHLLVRPTGLKSWRLKYRFGGVEKQLVLGSYPDVSLAEARDKRDAARRELREHRDPSVTRIKQRAAAHASAGITFELVARQWHQAQLTRWSKPHADTVIESFERDVFPRIGKLPIVEVDIPIVLGMLEAVQRRGAVETAHRLRQRVSAVFIWACSKGLATTDPADKVGAVLVPIPKAIKQPAIVEVDELQALTLAVDVSTSDALTKLASRLLSLTAVRPSVLRGAEWIEFEEIDWDDRTAGPRLPLWRVPASRMKLERDRKDEAAFEHLVPLSWQAVDALRAIRRLTGRGRLLFPNARQPSKPMSENAIGYLYNRSGYFGRHVPHGWRAAFSTILNERAKRAERARIKAGADVEVKSPDREVIDLMLAHIPEGVSSSEGAYNRAAYMTRRRELAQEWADLLLAGLPPANDLIDGPRR